MVARTPHACPEQGFNLDGVVNLALARVLSLEIVIKWDLALQLDLALISEGYQMHTHTCGKPTFA